MYVGNVVLLVLNLPLVGLFVNFLRIPYRILYPTILMFCVVGVYAVNSSYIDVGIMSIMGVLGLSAPKIRFRDGAHRPGGRPGADLRDESAPVPGHVERKVFHFLPAPHFG